MLRLCVFLTSSLLALTTEPSATAATEPSAASETNTLVQIRKMNIRKLKGAVHNLQAAIEEQIQLSKSEVEASKSSLVQAGGRLDTVVPEADDSAPILLDETAQNQETSDATVKVANPVESNVPGASSGHPESAHVLNHEWKECEIQEDLDTDGIVRQLADCTQRLKREAMKASEAHAASKHANQEYSQKFKNAVQLLGELGDLERIKRSLHSDHGKVRSNLVGRVNTITSIKEMGDMKLPIHMLGSAAQHEA